MPKVVTVEEMREIEEKADASGLSYAQMMSNAGKSIADAVLERVGEIQGKRVVLLIGSGNNGGDGLVIGYHLSEAGASVSAYLMKKRQKDDGNLSRLQDLNLEISVLSEDKNFDRLSSWLESADIVVDAVLGTGMKLPLKGTAKQLLSRAGEILNARQMRPYIVAVDCPSGLDCDSGELAGEALFADLTVTLAAAKPGLFRFPGAAAVGELVVGDIGLPEDEPTLAKVHLRVADPVWVRDLLPSRPRNAHKGTFGEVIILAGSINYPGAAGLAGLAAYRAGAGLVHMAVPSPIQTLIAPMIPEAIWLLLPHDMGVINESATEVIRPKLSSAQAILIGPGFGKDKSTGAFLARLLGASMKAQKAAIGFVHPDALEGEEILLPDCVVDADALKLLSEMVDWPNLLPKETVLTPHPGEMAIMTGMSKDKIQGDRVGVAKSWAEKWGHIVVLKGAFTVVAAPNGRAAIIPFATPALARAGTGDVLAGAIAGFRAQGMAGYEAAVAGAYIHGRAGCIVAEGLGTETSVLASEVAEMLPEVFSELKA